MGRWKEATFKEHIREELACFSMGMPTDMKRKFNFLNIAGNAFHDVTDEIMGLEERGGQETPYTAGAGGGETTAVARACEDRVPGARLIRASPRTPVGVGMHVLASL